MKTGVHRRQWSMDLSFRADVLPVDRASYWDLELSVTDCGAGNPMPAFLGFREVFFDVPVVSGWVGWLCRHA